MTLDQILNAINNLPLKDALTFLAANKIFDLGKSGYEKIARVIKEKTNEGKYGFVPSKKEASFLQGTVKKGYFHQFNQILPKNKYSDYVRVGYLIANLNSQGGETNRAKVKAIKASVVSRPNGFHLLKVVNLVTTGAIVPIVDYLQELKNKGYTADYISNAFEEILNEWKRFTFFVKSDTTEKQIIFAIENKMKIRQKIVMVFAYGSAIMPAVRAIAQFRLRQPKLNEDYYYESKNHKEAEKEVHSSSFILLD